MIPDLAFSLALQGGACSVTVTVTPLAPEALQEERRFPEEGPGVHGSLGRVRPTAATETAPRQSRKLRDDRDLATIRFRHDCC